jgi:hypothetical protein
MAADCENRHSLDEFGPYKTLPDAESTLKTALEKIILQGGGTLCIPLDAPAGFYPRNRIQDGVDEPGVTILDLRRGFERAYVPPIGALSSEGTRGSRIVERDLAQDLQWQDNLATEAIVSRYRGGASSFFNQLARAAAARTDRLYVPTHQGLFIGQTLLVTGKAYALPHDMIRVKELGLDSNGLYLISREALKEDHPAEGFIYNKSSVNGLTIRDTSNCDNQSATLAVDRTTYGTGDTFAIASRLTYQGNIMSGGGDEGGVGVASQIEHDLDCFWGEVESWDAAARKLVYKPVLGAPQKLGTSRPLINMNGSKHHKKGKILVVPPNYMVLGEPNPSGMVIGKDVAWDSSMVGRFLAIDVATERYGADEKNAMQTATGHEVHRWWRIAELRKRGDGLWVLKVERTVTWTSQGGPTLFRWDNYTIGDGNLKWHDYIIAPGAWVSDVRRGVAGDKPGNIGQANAGDERTIFLAPSTSTGPLDFAKDDPITNPPGPDVWIPTAFRARHFDSFPGMMQGVSFLSESSSKVQLGAALLVNGTSQTLAAAAASQKDGAPMFAAGVEVVACTKNAFLLRGEVEQDAIRLSQLNDKPNRITWLCKGMTWGSSLHADPASGNFVFFGGDLDFQDRGSLHQSGLSATGIAARNLSAVKVPVPAGAKEIVLPLRQEHDADYGILVECSWLTLKAVTDKTKTSFKILFDTAAPAGATLDWLLVR